MELELSIITVNLNNGNGLAKTITSVICQRFNKYEFIVVDGASTDNSIEVIKQFQTYISFWISEKDKGIYHAMNKGIMHARGRYLLFLNSGDWLVNDLVLNKVFSESRIQDILLGQCNISENGKIIHTLIPPPQISFGYIYYLGLSHQSAFIKREVFEKHGLYREDFKYNGDIEFWYRTIVLNGCTTESLPVIITDYNLDGISSKENHSEAYRNELDEIYAHPVLRLLIPDYEDWKREREEMKMMYWAKSKPALNFLIKGMFGIASGLKKIRK